MTVGGETAFVTDTDAVGVVALTVGAYLGVVSASVNGAVTSDVIVIADVAESSMMHVVTAAILRRKVFPFRRGAAMDDE
jgi:hypothetical protein